MELSIYSIRDLPVVADPLARYQKLLQLLTLCVDNEEFRPFLKSILKNHERLKRVVELPKHSNPAKRFEYGFEERVGEFLKNQANQIALRSINLIR